MKESHILYDIMLITSNGAVDFMYLIVGYLVYQKKKQKQKSDIP